MAQISPMMQHYLDTKEKHKDCILFYRLGDFYEMFFDDAQLVSRELELTLTGKQCGLEERAPMCGIPYHACDTYVTRLIEKGYRIAICEQVEDPKQAKGMVKREVTRIITPGTNTAEDSLDASKNNFLMAIIWQDDRYGVATVDVTTGDFYVTEVTDTRKVMDEITKFGPTEILVNAAMCMSELDLEDLRGRLGICISHVDDWTYDIDNCEKVLREHFHVKSLFGLGISEMGIGVNAAGCIMNFLYETQKTSLGHITGIQAYRTGKYMILDSAARRNLELCETLREKQKRGSLLWVLDKTKTAMGARLLRLYLEQPLLDKKEIVARQDAISDFLSHMSDREECREYLDQVYDLERLVCRVSYQNASPRDLTAFKASIGVIPGIKICLKDMSSKLLREQDQKMDPLEDLYQLIDAAINPDAPLSVKEGDIIRPGFHEEVDRLRAAKTDGKKWLSALEEREREATGIKNLKIKYNNVFGYFFDVTNSFKDLVPDTWMRKQTLAGSERYTTTELKELEDTILGAEDKLFSLEYNLFVSIREQVAAQAARIQQTAKAVATVDCMASLAYVADHNHYVRPEITEDGSIQIIAGRHPVVEKMIPNNMFVDNDTLLDNGDNRISIITGPNMAGKSTYMRQTALIVLLAQVGSYVPAKEARIGIVDRIFTRVGASDDLASGQSTFMVEMNEVANILRNATKKSLLILDEIGRGTSTFDGLAIAWSVIEHVSDRKAIGAKTLFATHYHELTELEGQLDGVKNYCIAVKEQGDDIVFLRKIIRGGADKSYGIQVARLAGVPDVVLNRAKEIVAELLSHDLAGKARNIAEQTANASPVEKSLLPRENGRFTKRNKDVEGQLSLFGEAAPSPVVQRLKELDLGNLTPIDALNLLYELQKEAKDSV